MRLRIDLAYDGTDFHGWATQPGLRTVQAELTAALAMVLRLDRVEVQRPVIQPLVHQVHAYQDVRQAVLIDVQVKVEVQAHDHAPLRVFLHEQGHARIPVLNQCAVLDRFDGEAVFLQGRHDALQLHSVNRHGGSIKRVPQVKCNGDRLVTGKCRKRRIMGRSSLIVEKRGDALSGQW